jgi:excisionase family DNA binding protein
MLNQYGDILSVEDVSGILAIGKNRTYELLSTGALKGFQIGKRWKIPRDAVEEYILQQCKMNAHSS